MERCSVSTYLQFVEPFYEDKDSAHFRPQLESNLLLRNEPSVVNIPC